MTVRKGIPRLGKHRICVPTENTRRRNGAGSLFGENGNQTKRRTHMENNLKKLPPLERKPDGSLYRMTPAQRKRANALIRRECCSYDSGNCIVLDDGDTCICPQTISFSVCCKHFRDKDTKRCIVCRRAFVPGSNRAKYCPDCAVSVHRRQKAESERKRRACVDN